MEKEPFFESVRTKVAAVVGAAMIVFTALAGLFPELQVVEVNQDILDMLILAVTAIVCMIVYGRTHRNTRLGG